MGDDAYAYNERPVRAYMSEDRGRNQDQRSSYFLDAHNLAKEEYIEDLRRRLYNTFHQSESVTYRSHPDYFACRPQGSRSDSGQNQQGSVTVTYLGCNSLYITDGTTKLIIDPFFSRPTVDVRHGRSELIQPNSAVVEGTLEYAGITQLDAILVTHAHWDHSLDLGRVWRTVRYTSNNNRFNIYGSMSARHVVCGDGVPQTNFTVVRRDTHEFRFGSFTVKFLDGAHFPYPLGSITEDLMGNIREDVTPPAMVNSYKQGTMYAIFIEHPAGTILNIGSANFIRGYHRRIFGSGSVRKPDVLIIGAAGLNMARLYAPAIPYNFYREVVIDSNPRGLTQRILLTHWEEFTFDTSRLSFPVRWMYRAYNALEMLRSDERSYPTRLRSPYVDIGETDFLTGGGRPYDTQDLSRTPIAIEHSNTINLTRREHVPIQFMPLSEPLTILPDPAPGELFVEGPGRG